jgi:hypothetical protein
VCEHRDGSGTSQCRRRDSRSNALLGRCLPALPPLAHLALPRNCELRSVLLLLCRGRLPLALLLLLALLAALLPQLLQLRLSPLPLSVQPYLQLLLSLSHEVAPLHQQRELAAAAARAKLHCESQCAAAGGP